MGWVPDEWSIDHESLIEAGGYVQRLKMYPYFDAAHYILTCLSIRQDLGPDAIQFSRKHPFSCWLSCLLMSFAGSFLSGFLLGEPIVTPLKRHDDVILATIVWYFVFYSPFDIFYKLCNLFPVKVGLSVLKEIQRASKIAAGVKHAGRIYPESYLVQILVGVAKGAGAGVVKIVEQLARGTWIPTNHEILRPSFTTKACVVAASVFTMERHSMYVTAPHDLVYLCVVGFFVYFKLASLCLSVHDVLQPIENILCAIFMGGIIDAFAKAVESTKQAIQSNRSLSEEEILAKEREKVLKKKKALQTQSNGVDKKND
uniref:Trimeric intracellular cation channel type B n=1 Tax=Caenorhabditis japonica TaxID=281687 RepID=A0A8R1HNQ6_CAEJA